MSLADEIFPPSGHPALVQTEWARGWGYQSIGFAEAARFLTENKARFHAGIDQVGLVVFFLQRHRVELALKGLLVAHGTQLTRVNPPHSLEAAWRACEELVGSASESWRYLHSAGAELVKLLHEYDRSSDAYRYPVDRNGKDHQRPEFIDLDALERHVTALVGAIEGYMDYSAEARELQRNFEREVQQEYGDY
jgi:hypothetical protein